MIMRNLSAFSGTFTFSLLLSLSGCGDDSGDTSGTATTDASGTATTTDASGTATTTAGTDTATTTETSTTADTTSTTGTASDSDGTGSTGDGDGGFCQEQCMNDGDCTVSGVDSGFVCERGRCVGSGDGCSGDDECVAQLSGWVVVCESQIECPGQVCVDIGGGEGRCATAPSDVVPCETLLQEEAEYPPIEGGEPLTVCAQTAAECRDGACRLACTSDAACVSPSAPVCDVESGDCVCATDAHCEGVPGASVCVEGRCQCSGDADCEDVDNGDVCSDGACGCSSVRACGGDPVFDGTEQVCEPL